LLGFLFCSHDLGRPSQRQEGRRADEKDDVLVRTRVLDLAVEIESLPREMPTSIQQYQVVGMSSPLNPRSTKILGSLHLDAVTAQDAGTNVTSALVGIDEENFLVIENRAGTKWWWLVHTKLRKPERVCGRLGGFSSREGGKSSGELEPG
jgi:hypothetical protein